MDGERKTRSTSSSSSSSSQDLLTCGRGGGIQAKLLLKPQHGGPLQTEKVPRSSVLDRLQSFLPQMSAANDKLMEQMTDAPAGRFDIECVEEETERVIQMDVALVELSGSEEEEEEETSDEEKDSDEEEKEVTEQNLKLPSDGDSKKKKANIQVL